jgi:hypothetical protein
LEVLKETSPNFARTVSSLATAFVDIHRYDIQDLHHYNIGMDNKGEVFLFDVERAFEGDNLDVTHLTQQPNKVYHGDLVDFSFNLKASLGKHQKLFQCAVYKAILKEMICPERLSERIASQNVPQNNRTFAQSVVEKLLVSKTLFRQQVLSDPAFITYLLIYGEKDCNEIMQEFEQAREKNPDYFDKDFSERVREDYDKLLNDVRVCPFYQFIHAQEKPITEAACQKWMKDFHQSEVANSKENMDAQQNQCDALPVSLEVFRPAA